MPERRVDVLVVGAGPAGLAAAIALGRNDLNVLVCERMSLPRDKACGEGVMPTGVEYLTKLGASKYLDEQQLRPLLGIRFHSTSGFTAAARFAEGHGLGIRRTNLSDALFQAARRWPSIEIRERATVRRLEVMPDGVCLQIGNELVKARLAIGADGLYSPVRRWAGLEGPPQRLRRLGARQHFETQAPESFVDVFQGHGIEAYVTPCGGRQTGLAILWDPAVFRHAQRGHRLFPSLMAAFPHLEQRYVRGRALSEPVSSGPLHRVSRGRAADGILLIGDAGGYIDACTGEGISIALAQALELETTVVPALKQQNGGTLRLNALSPYVDACRRITRPYEIGTNLQLFMCRHPWLANPLVRALATNEDILANLLAANMGKGSFWPGWKPGLRLVKTLLAIGVRTRGSDCNMGQGSNE